MKRLKRLLKKRESKPETQPPFVVVTDDWGHYASAMECLQWTSVSYEKAVQDGKRWLSSLRSPEESSTVCCTGMSDYEISRLKKELSGTVHRFSKKEKLWDRAEQKWLPNPLYRRTLNFMMEDGAESGTKECRLRIMMVPDGWP